MVALIRLQDISLKGNTHLPMSDLSNVEVANVMYEDLKKHLD